MFEEGTDVRFAIARQWASCLLPLGLGSSSESRIHIRHKLFRKQFHFSAEIYINLIAPGNVLHKFEKLQVNCHKYLYINIGILHTPPPTDLL
jgi:hypothetical protein